MAVTISQYYSEQTSDLFHEISQPIDKPSFEEIRSFLDMIREFKIPYGFQKERKAIELNQLRFDL